MMRALVLSTMFWAAALAMSGCASTSADNSTQAGLVNHVVVVWLKDEYRNRDGVAKIIEAQESLRDIPGLVSLTVGRVIPSDRPVVDSTYDFASIFQFDSVAAMQEYLQHPVHVAFIEEYAKPMSSRTLVYDFK